MTMDEKRTPANLVLLSDYGDGNGVADMIGVVKRVDARLRVYDLTHDVPTFGLARAAELLSDQLCAWPAGTVFVCAVDPAVGTAQRVVAAQTLDGYFLVAPDNGCLADAVAAHGLKALSDLHELNAAYAKTERSALYHGRNLVYCAAHLASGLRTMADIGTDCLADGVRQHD